MAGDDGIARRLQHIWNRNQSGRGRVVNRSIRGGQTGWPLQCSLLGIMAAILCLGLILSLWHFLPPGNLSSPPSPPNGPSADHSEMLPAVGRLQREPAGQLDEVGTRLRAAPIYTYALKTVAFHPTDELLATGSGDGQVRLWNLAEGTLQHAIQAHSTWAFSVAFRPDGRLLVSGGGDNLVRTWEVATGRKVHELAGHTDDVHGVVFLGGERIASAGDDRAARIWDLASGEALLLTGHSLQVTAVAASRDSKLLATASRDATVQLWSADTGAHWRTLEGHTADVLDVAFSADGSRLVTASYDGTARVWDVATGEPLRTMRGHNGWVFAAAIAPDGERLASGGGDETVRLWSMASGELLHTIDAGADVASLAFSPEGELLAAALTNGAVNLYHVAGELPRLARQLGRTPRD